MAAPSPQPAGGVAAEMLALQKKQIEDANRRAEEGTKRAADAAAAREERMKQDKEERDRRYNDEKAARESREAERKEKDAQRDKLQAEQRAKAEEAQRKREEDAAKRKEEQDQRQAETKAKVAKQAEEREAAKQKKQEDAAGKQAHLAALAKKSEEAKFAVKVDKVSSDFFSPLATLGGLVGAVSAIAKKPKWEKMLDDAEKVVPMERITAILTDYLRYRSPGTPMPAVGTTLLRDMLGRVTNQQTHAGQSYVTPFYLKLSPLKLNNLPAMNLTEEAAKDLVKFFTAAGVTCSVVPHHKAV